MSSFFFFFYICVCAFFYPELIRGIKYTKYFFCFFFFGGGGECTLNNGINLVQKDACWKIPLLLNRLRNFISYLCAFRHTYAHTRLYSCVHARKHKQTLFRKKKKRKILNIILKDQLGKNLTVIYPFAYGRLLFICIQLNNQSFFCVEFLLWFLNNQ